MMPTPAQTGRILTITLSGSLDQGRQPRLKEDLVRQIPSDAAPVVLDFSQVHFIDSSCLGTVVALVRKLRKKGGDIRLAGLSEEVRSIFQITRLDKIFKIYDKTEEALASFGG